MFQVLDDKGDCVGIYKNGELSFTDQNLDSQKTWNYVSFLKGQDIDYAQLYCGGKTLDDIAPAHLKKSLQDNSKKLNAFLKSFSTARVSLKENCFYDLVPERFLKELCEIKNRISQHVFDTYEKPSEYTFIREFNELLYDISNRNVQIDRDCLKTKLYLPQGKKLWEKVNNNQTSIKFNMFSSVTGRLTTNENSFPILTLPSKLRDVMVPTNDWYVSLDLNAAEMRIALALAGEDQPEGDVHEHVRLKVFGEDTTRAQAKNISTQWLYDARNEDTIKYDTKLSEFYNKEQLFADYLKNGQVITPYGRKIDTDNHHFISYLCQSTLIDMFHRQILKINKKLEGKSSFIPFPLHDQVLIDLKDSEKNLLPDIIRELSTTPYGTFPVKVEIGNNFGNMKKVNIKV